MLQKVEICGVDTAGLPLLTAKESEELMKKLKEGDAAAREKFLDRPYIAFAPEPHAAMVQNLYTEGATTVQTEEGYGVFFVERDVLVFRELAARGNLAATRILEAARQHTACDRARLELPRYGEVFLGEGETVPYGMLRWLRGEKKLSGEPTMSLMCD